MLLCAVFMLLLLVTPLPTPSVPAAFVPPPILMYHRVDPDPGAGAVASDLTVSPARLREQLEYLRSRGIAAISMAQLEQRLERGEPLDHVVVMTFDDGYADQYRYAVPLLHEFGDSATFYIITGQLGQPRHLTWRQLRTMADMHLDIAAHGVQHDDLSLMNPAQQTYQIEQSVRELHAFLHAPIESYAYPSGRFNRETLAIMRHADVPLAVTTDPAYVLPPENRFEMTRVRVHGGWRLADFASAVQSAFFHPHLVLR